MRQENINIIPSQAAVTFTSPAIPAYNLIACSVQITSTGAGAGTLIIQASNDIITSSSVQPSNWTAISGATVTVAGAGSVIIPNTALCYEYIRVVYTNTGTGTISARLKTLGE